jgi:hypothetical protein
MTDDARTRRARAVTRIVRPGEHQDISDEAWDRQYWTRIPVEERFAEAWRLSLEQWTLSHPGQSLEPGLSRSVAVLRRP